MNTDNHVNMPKHGERGFQKTHGLRKSPEYNSWNGIKHRCHNPNYGGYKKYGARGIRMCARWRDSFEAFYEDMGPRPSPRHSVDRVDNEGDYTPENCRWATPREQMNNQRKTIRVMVNGVEKTLREIADEAGVPITVIQSRYRLGYPVEKLTHPGKIAHRDRRWRK
jgi:hypothetical protein